MPDRQITFQELLKDPIFKAYTRRKPDYQGGRKPLQWIVYLQIRKPDGSLRWAIHRENTYVAAFNFLAKNFSSDRLDIVDAAIHCPSRMWAQPFVRRPNPRFNPKKKVDSSNPRTLRRRWRMPAGHLWCPLCRRPTRWGYYPKGHHAVSRKYPSNGDILRCRICGVRQPFVRRYQRG